MSQAICIEAIHKTYPRGWRRPPKEALRGISLTIDAGETFGFIGPNGAGKSTLIKILIGAMRPTTGSATIFACDVRNPEARRGLGFVPENPSLQDHLTPYETLRMGMRLHGLRLDDERQHCLHWLERFDLAAVADSRLRGFSKGMLQRTALAHALAIQPRLLILDEPLSGLDPIGRRDVVDILSDYKRGGGTLFLTSHVLHDVERLADRFGLIHEGVLRAVRSPEELTGDQEMVLVRSLGQLPVAAMREDFSGRWIGEVPRTELWACLDALHTAGHVLLEVRPSLSLEVAFMRVVGQS